MGRFVANIQFRPSTAVQTRPDLLDRWLEEYLDDKDELVRTHDLGEAYFSTILSPLRPSGWQTIFCSPCDGFDLKDSLEFARFFSLRSESEMVVNFVMDSDEAISVILDKGKIVKALSNRKRNISQVKIDLLEGKSTRYDDLDKVWRKRELFKEALVENTALFFKDDPACWLANAGDLPADMVIAFKNKHHFSQYAESTSPPRIVWSGSSIPKAASTSFNIREQFSNLGRRFIGVGISITDVANPANIRNVSNVVIKDDLTRAEFTQSDRVTDGEKYQFLFNSIEVVGGVYEIALKYSNFKYPAIFACDFLLWKGLSNEEGKEIGRMQVCGRSYTVTAFVELIEPSSSVSYKVFPLEAPSSAVCEYLIGQQDTFPTRNHYDIREEVAHGKEPRPTALEKIELIRASGRTNL